MTGKIRYNVPVSIINSYNKVMMLNSKPVHQQQLTMSGFRYIPILIPMLNVVAMVTDLCDIF